LYTSSPRKAHPELLESIPPVVSEDDNAFLTAMPDEDEIKSTVFEKDVPWSRWLPRKLLSNLLAYHRQRRLQGDPILFFP
jgi:hypothetical protein